MYKYWGKEYICKQAQTATHVHLSPGYWQMHAWLCITSCRIYLLCTLIIYGNAWLVWVWEILTLGSTRDWTNFRLGQITWNRKGKKDLFSIYSILALQWPALKVYSTMCCMHAALGLPITYKLLTGTGQILKLKSEASLQYTETCTTMHC